MKFITIMMLAGLISGCENPRHAAYRQMEEQNAVDHARVVAHYNQLHPGAEWGTPAWQATNDAIRAREYEFDQTPAGRAIKMDLMISEMQVELSRIGADLAVYGH